MESESNPDSARRSAEFMTKMRLGSERALARRIESKELVSKDELIAMLGGRRRWVNEALKAGRPFSLTPPLDSRISERFMLTTATSCEP